MNNRYHQLMGALAQSYDCDKQKLITGEPLLVNGVTFRFEHNSIIATERLVVYCQYGEIPEQHETDACKALLEANLLLFCSRGPGTVFTLSPEDGKVWLADSHDLNTLSLPELTEYLSRTVAQVELWQQDYFLTQPIDEQVAEPQSKTTLSKHITAVP